MKRTITRLFSITAAVILLLAGSTHKTNAQDVEVSYQTFYDNLSPYGQWVYDPQYGNVWVPNEDGDFRPYGSRGRWVMTDYGNTWVSDDPWGWAVYHYGRWTYNPYYGWIWVPGYEWAPAWVSWRYGGGYCGWAPLGPGVTVGMSYYAPDNWWVFVGPQYMYEPNCIRYWSGPSYNVTYIRQTTIINNYYQDNRTRVRYNYGPRAEVIQQYTRTPVQVYNVTQLNRPGAPSIGRNTVSLYRPSVNRASIDGARPGRVMQAPQPIGRAQPVQYGSGRQPGFRQEMMRNPQEGRGGAVQTTPSRGGDDRINRYDEPSGGRNQPAPSYNTPSQNGRNDNTQYGRGRYQNNDDIRYDAPQQNGRNDDRMNRGRFDANSDRDANPSETRNSWRSRADRDSRVDQPQPEVRREQPAMYDRRMDTRLQQPQQPQNSQPPRFQQPPQPQSSQPQRTPRSQQPPPQQPSQYSQPQRSGRIQQNPQPQAQPQAQPQQAQPQDGRGRGR